MNKVMMIGRLTSDPEIRYTQDNKCVARFRFAVNRTYKREGEPEADFFGCTTFGKVAETFDRLHIAKGAKLMIEGELRNNNYTDRDGIKKYENRIIVSTFEFCESKSSTAPAQNTPESTENGADNDWMPIPDNLDDPGLPFD